MRVALLKKNKIVFIPFPCAGFADDTLPFYIVTFNSGIKVTEEMKFVASRRICRYKLVN